MGILSRYQATLDRLEIKPSKSGNQTLVITATLIEDQSPQELHFPLHLPFKLRDARQALQILIGKKNRKTTQSCISWPMGPQESSSLWWWSTAPTEANGCT